MCISLLKPIFKFPMGYVFSLLLHLWFCLPLFGFVRNKYMNIQICSFLHELSFWLILFTYLFWSQQNMVSLESRFYRISGMPFFGWNATLIYVVVIMAQLFIPFS
jgi:hypothetical protein